MTINSLIFSTKDVTKGNIIVLHFLSAQFASRQTLQALFSTLISWDPYALPPLVKPYIV
jgi:hypothetical protein